MILKWIVRAVFRVSYLKKVDIILDNTRNVNKNKKKYLSIIML